MQSKTAPTETVRVPSCPACRSADVKTTTPVATAESYWRCLVCGEVWNVGRRESSQRSRYGWSGR
jgi:transposase-like protein